jgi:hypothetical protein
MSSVINRPDYKGLGFRLKIFKDAEFMPAVMKNTYMPVNKGNIIYFL